MKTCAAGDTSFPPASPVVRVLPGAAVRGHVHMRPPLCGWSRGRSDGLPRGRVPARRLLHLHGPDHQTCAAVAQRRAVGDMELWSCGGGVCGRGCCCSPWGGGVATTQAALLCDEGPRPAWVGLRWAAAERAATPQPGTAECLDAAGCFRARMREWGTTPTPGGGGSLGSASICECGIKPRRLQQRPVEGHRSAAHASARAAVKCSNVLLLSIEEPWSAGTHRNPHRKQLISHAPSLTLGDAISEALLPACVELSLPPSQHCSSGCSW